MEKGLLISEATQFHVVMPLNSYQKPQPTFLTSSSNFFMQNVFHQTQNLARRFELCKFSNCVIHGEISFASNNDISERSAILTSANKSMCKI